MAQDHPSPQAIDLESLNLILSELPPGPAKAHQLAMASRRLYADPSVVEFFESIPRDTEFGSKKDVMLRAQEVALLQEEESQTDSEKLRSYEG